MRIILITGVYPGAQTGGAEVQTMLLAQGLVERGHQVLFLATESGAERHFVSDEGIIVQELPGSAVTNAATHSQQIEKHLRAFAPDICYVRLLIEFERINGICARLGVPVVSISVSHMEASPILQGGTWQETVNYWRTTRPWYHWNSFRSIRQSAVHLCNTEELATKTRRWIRSVPIRTIYNAAPPAPPDEIHSVPGAQIIWVNNLKRLKRPELYIELARRLPQYQFLMVGALPPGGRYAAQCRAMLARAPKNLTYLGFQPLDEVNRYIGASDLLLYTSVNEGFGNSFLQAWFRGVPTGSLTSTLDGILERERIGFVVQTMDDLTESVDRVMADPHQRMAMGARARTYANAYHSCDVMVATYENLFRSIVCGEGRDVVDAQVGQAKHSLNIHS